MTWLMINFTFFFFRARGFHEAIDVIKYSFSYRNPWVLTDGSLYTCGLDSKNFHIVIVSIAVLLFADIVKRRGIRIRQVIAAQDYPCRWAVMIFAICFILVFGIWGSGYDTAGFIYFQF